MKPADAATIAGASVAVAGGTAALVTTWNPRLALLNPQPANIGEVTETWATTVREVRYGAIPANAREVPLLMAARTPFGRNPASSHTRRAGALTFFGAIRSLLDASGRGDEDARAVGLLLAVESGWGVSAWNNNLGNVKAQGTVYARSVREILQSGRVYTTNYESVGVYILRDRLRSLDGYHSYATPDVFMRRQAALFRNGYPGVLEGYREGGLDGLVRAERALAAGGYSPEGALRRVARAHWYWRRWGNIVGPAWQQRM